MSVEDEAQAHSAQAGPGGLAAEAGLRALSAGAGLRALSAEAGLRARKKQRTRQALSEAATQLFAERGFESVTIAEIAARADVGVGTVFNYFRAKEDLFFDRADAIEQDLLATVTSRPATDSIATAFRAWHARELTLLLDPRAEAPVARYFATIAASHTLRLAELALFDRLQTALSSVDNMPTVLPALLMAIHRTCVTTVRDALPLGLPTASHHAHAASDAGFAALSPTTLAWGSVSATEGENR